MFHFMEDNGGVDLSELVPRADLREFIDREFGHVLELSPASGSKILILTEVHDREANVVGVELLKRGVDYIRLNSGDFSSRAFVTCTADGGTSSVRIRVGHDEVISRQICTVWYRYLSLEPFGLHLDFDDPLAVAFAHREWRWAMRSVTGSLGCFWVSPPDAMVTAGDRFLQLRRASEVGLDVPRTIMTNDPSKVREFYDECAGRIMAKVVNLHSIGVKGRLFNVFGRRLRREDLDLLDSVRYVPSIFQEYVPKRVEVRVTVVGDRLFAAEIHSQVNENSRDDYHRGSPKDIPVAVHHLPAEIDAKCRSLVYRMGLLFGALDLILTPDGPYVFLEVNACGDWWGIEVKTGLPITQAVVDLLIEGSHSPLPVSGEAISK